MRAKTIDDVVKWRLCVGCGACAWLSNGKIAMEDDFSQGHRPVWNGPGDEGLLKDCLKVCPAFGSRLEPMSGVEGLAEGLGPVLEVWEGHAMDPVTRHLGSSGGALTALAAYAIEKGGMHGVLHVAADKDKPLSNRTMMSRSREELLSNTGSRYAPASVCDGLQQIEDAPAPCVFIGQPSEVTALRKAEALRPELARKVGVAMSFFCAGSPSTKGTAELLKSRGIDPEAVEKLRYRGRGWPGMFAVWLKGQSEPVLEMTYAESWGFVQAHRPWGVHLWPDGSGEHADISCGDPWYRKVSPGEQGSSLVVVRTEAGRRLVREAMAAGYLELTPADLKKVADSQKNLLLKRGSVYGRILSMRFLGLPAPSHVGYGLLGSWMKLPLKEKAACTVGTVRRILSRKYYKPAARGLGTKQGS